MLQRQRNKGTRKRRERGRARHAAQKPFTQGQMHPRLRLMMQLDWTQLFAYTHGARVMLTSNLWTGVGLVNGAMGTVILIAICYKSGQAPPNLPVPVMLRFDSYPGPTLPDGTVPIVPIRHTWSASSAQCSRLQLPLKLAWAVTIHKAQGLTLDKVVIDVGKKEFACGLTFIACSRVRTLTDLLFNITPQL